MTKQDQVTLHPNPYPVWFYALLLLDGFALGGLVVWRFVLTFLESAMTGFVTPSGEIFHVLDKLFPYWLGHAGITLLLLLITASTYLWLKSRLVMASALTVIVPIALIVWFWISQTSSWQQLFPR